MKSLLYKESKQFLRPLMEVFNKPLHSQPASEKNLLNYVLQKSQKGNPVDVINKIDEYCSKNWMMNLGDQKGRVVLEKGFSLGPVKKVLEIGGYCGYSALVFANQIAKTQGAMVYTVQISKEYASIARQIHEHAGLADRIHINIGVISSSEEFLKQKGPFDLIFIDHVKTLYLSDFLLLEKYGVIQKGTVVVGDNIICPGSPDYLEHFKNREDYDSTLYHTFLEYSNIPDAVLISKKI